MWIVTTIFFMVLFSAIYSTSSEADALAELYCCMQVSGTGGTGGHSIRELDSCKNIKAAEPSSQTGYYPMIDSSGNFFGMYCNMDTLCGSGGGWSRIGFLNMSDYRQKCPDNWEEYTKDTGGIRTCRRSTDGASCDSVVIPSLDIQYTEICGRVVGYQYASVDAVYTASYRKNINSYYVDGVSITRGTPRQHVWTLMAGVNQNGVTNWYSQCPCHAGCGGNMCSPQWVTVETGLIGNDWYCESGNNEKNNWRYKSYMSDPLWDGNDCQPDESACCAQKPGQPPQPWFHKVITGETKDHLEIRICCDEGKGNEGVLVTMYELYIK